MLQKTARYLPFVIPLVCDPFESFDNWLVPVTGVLLATFDPRFFIDVVVERRFIAFYGLASTSGTVASKHRLLQVTKILLLSLPKRE